MRKNKQFFSLPVAKATLTICYILAYVMILAPSFLAMHVKQTASPANMWLLWFDVFSGNFSGTHGVVNDWAYWFSAILSVLLNNAVIIIVVTFIWRFFMERRERVFLVEQILAMRDTMSKTIIFNNLGLKDNPEATEKLNESFREINEKWFNYMARLIPQDEVQKIKEMLKEEI